MAKFILALAFCLFLFMGVYAQNGGLVYYLKNNGKLVSIKDSADYSMVVLPPDTSIDKNLYQVYEYDKNGKLKFVTNSKTNDINLQYQGTFISYYPSGKKKQMVRFEKGQVVGRAVEFYPNGKLYAVTNYTNKDIFLTECRDSTGNVLAENGKGKWIQYGNDDFTKIQAEGNVENGLREGQWNGIINFKYHLGRVVSTSVSYTNSDDYPGFYSVEKYPGFPGGTVALGRFINSNIQYPDKAKQKGTQGKVQVRFIVEKDGSLSGISIAQSLGDGCDEEAIRIVKLLPNWIPGVINRKRASIPDSIPVYFSLTNSSVNTEIGNAKYMLMNSGYRVYRKDSADYFLAITPNNIVDHKSRFIVKAFYPNGQLKFTSGSNINELRTKYKDHIGFFEPVLQGSCISFFSDGRKKSISYYENGDLAGEETEYYPNGIVHTIKSYTAEKKKFYKECRDSTGNVLVDNGNGKGLEFIDDGFKNYIRGEVANGLEEGEWLGKRLDTVNIVWEYNKGSLLTSSTVDGSGNKIYTKTEIAPEFSGGMTEFVRFLGKNIRYPVLARENGVKGKVVISYIVEADGSISNAKIVKGIGRGCEEEALRVMRLSPKWSPGIVNGKPVRVAYSVPISFALSN